MKCRYCGKDVRPVGTHLESRPGGFECSGSSNRRHATFFDGVHCIHCGRKVKVLNGDRLVTSHGVSCPGSPSGIHVLQ